MSQPYAAQLLLQICPPMGPKEHLPFPSVHWWEEPCRSVLLQLHRACESPGRPVGWSGVPTPVLPGRGRTLSSKAGAVSSTSPFTSRPPRRWLAATTLLRHVRKQSPHLFLTSPKRPCFKEQPGRRTLSIPTLLTKVVHRSQFY